MSYRDAKRAYRGRAKASGKLPSRFERGRFVAIDGEGFADGELIRCEVGAEHKVYEARDHFYALLMDSDGNEIWKPAGRISTKECLDFLLNISTRDKFANVVCFGGSYDVCHMLGFGLSRDAITELLRKDITRTVSLDITLSDDRGQHDYRLEYRPRKSLTVWRFDHGAEQYLEVTVNKGKHNEYRRWKLNYTERVTVWDIWGFFQGSFVAALDNWLPGDKDYDFVKQMKEGRSTFDRSEYQAISKYTKIELRCTVDLMNRVRDAIRALDLTISRWDGAGSIAGAMFKKHGVKDHMAPSPEVVFEAAKRAYSGGHIEACQVGYHSGKVYHYDVNSAYPNHFRRLPSLAHGQWRHWRHTRPDHLASPEFSIVRLEYHFLAGLPFYPCFHRGSNGSIIYPERGSGWYWYDEYLAAKQFADAFGCYSFDVKECYSFESQSNAKPFTWIEDAYARRQSLVAETKRTGVPNGEEKTIKFGLNSCYGKTAQQVGARINQGELQPPSYFQLEWSGFVAAGCRAQLMQAAIQKPEAIISFATDALFTTEPLNLFCPAEKMLGAWEFNEHEGITVVMPGVYWLHDKDKIRHYSRGFDKRTMSDPDFIHRAWSQGLDQIEVTQTRMITLGAAKMSDHFWKMRGLFVTAPRILRLNGHNTKRHPISVLRQQPHKGLVRTRPRTLPEDYDVPLSEMLSEPFKIKFLEQSENEDHTDEGAESFFLASTDTQDAFMLA